MPSVEQVIPWLEQIFDAWEERRRLREREAAERDALEAAVQDYAIDGDSDETDDDGDHRKKKKKKKHDHK